LTINLKKGGKMKGRLSRVGWIIVFILVGALLISQSDGIVKVKHESFSYNADVKVNGLRKTKGFSEGIYDPSYIGKVGGITFEKLAQPDNELSIESISLKYVSHEQDGMRLKAYINKKEVTVPIFDWMLKPVLLYSVFDYHPCISIFGTTGSRKRDQRYKEEYDLSFLVSYHPVFKNTLVGLRLLQMDISLISLAQFGILPKSYYNENIILGGGEERLYSKRYIVDWLNSIIWINGMKRRNVYVTYVIADDPRGIIIEQGGDILRIKGDLYFNFLKYNHERKKEMDEILSKIRKKFPDNNMEILNMVEERIMEDFDDAVIFLENQSNEFSENNNLRRLEYINPVVYNCVRDVMRYSAFFRYCYKKNPFNLLKLINRVASLDISPKIETPNGVTNDLFKFIHVRWNGREYFLW
jgi:hypothetical protein